jgi:ATP-dependent Clp protease protease subunit
MTIENPMADDDKKSADEDDGPVEIAVVGDLTDDISDLTESLLSVPRDSYCTIYFDCPGGNPYSALSLATLIRIRNIEATGIVTGECSSAAVWIFAACRRRYVTPYSMLLLHPMKWQSGEQIGIEEAVEWARHFNILEKQMDQLLADLLDVSLESLLPWLQPGRHVSGQEFADQGLAELIPLAPFDFAAIEPQEEVDGSDGDEESE